MTMEGPMESMGQTEKRWMIWFVWNFDRKEQQLDAESEQGLHLVRARKFRATYVRQPDDRYVYRMDYQPGLRTKARKAEYFTLYQDAGWMHLGQCAGWQYFRRPYEPGKTFELYTDRASIAAYYQRIQRVIGTLFCVELLLVAMNTYNLLVLNQTLPKWTTVVPLLALYLALVCLLGYGFMKVTQKVRRVKG